MAEHVPTYDELKLRVQHGAAGSYQVVAFAPDGSTAAGTFSLPFDETQLENFVLKVGQTRRGTRAYSTSQMEEAKRFGSQLFEALIADDVRDVYLSARQVAAMNEDRGLRLTLYLTDVPKLMEVPWEFLHEGTGFLSQSIFTPVVRSLDLKTVRRPRKLTLPLRILGMVSGPSGVEKLDVDMERAKLHEALSALERSGMVELRWLERATLSELNDAMSSPDDVHALHYIGHGAYNRRTEGGILVLENAHGAAHEVTGEELGSLLQDERSLRLVVLNSCEGARGSHVDPFSGVAASLVKHSIPAVIGMQFEITDEAAITFAGRLYSAIAQGLPVDAALAQSRKAIFAAGHDVEFGTPVLFLRAADAQLFDLQPSQTAPTERAPPEAHLNTAAPAGSPTEWSKGARQLLRIEHPPHGFRGRGRRDIHHVALSPDGRRIATTSEDKTARVWDVDSGRELTRVTHDHRVTHVAFSQDGRRIATTSSDETARVWDVDTGRELARITHDDDIRNLALSRDGQQIATTTSGIRWPDKRQRRTAIERSHAAWVWDAESGRELTRITLNDDWIGGVAFSPDGRWIAITSPDKTASVWEADGCRELTRVTHLDTVNHVAFSPDGKSIATSSNDRTARVWEAASGRELTRLTHDQSVARGLFHRDGSQIATTGNDDYVRVWDVHSGRELTRFPLAEARAYTAAFSADIKRLAIIHHDGAARVWEART